MNEELYVNIVNIKRFAVHDGEGIRTTAFFQRLPYALPLVPQSRNAFFARADGILRKELPSVRSLRKSVSARMPYVAA